MHVTREIMVRTHELIKREFEDRIKWTTNR